MFAQVRVEMHALQVDASREPVDARPVRFPDALEGNAHGEALFLRLVGAEEAVELLESAGALSLGLNDFLAAAANQYETYIYLLQQRAKG